MKTGPRLAMIVFIAVALAHLLRLIDGTEVTIGGWPVPAWASVVGVVVPAAIAWLLWRDR